MEVSWKFLGVRRGGEGKGGGLCRFAGDREVGRAGLWGFVGLVGLVGRWGGGGGGGGLVGCRDR